jgi:hypothetical protein
MKEGEEGVGISHPALSLYIDQETFAGHDYTSVYSSPLSP